MKESPFQLIAAMPPAISTGTASAAGAGDSAVAASSSSPAIVASRRKGSMRSPRRSDQRPAAARDGGAELRRAERNRRGGGRPAALVVEVEDEQRGHADLPDDHQRRRGAEPPDARIADCVGRGRRGRLVPRALAQPDRRGDGRDEHRAGERVQRGVEAGAAASGGSEKEPRRRPTGTAVCLSPSASPRSSRGNQWKTARPLAAIPLAPSAPASATPPSSAG